jgi:hypothetical protein
MAKLIDKTLVFNYSLKTPLGDESKQTYMA